MSGPRSVDPPRPRDIPTQIVSDDGTVVAFTSPTLVVAVKTNCDGCAAFYDGDLTPLGDVAVYLIAREPSPTWHTSRHRVLVAPSAFDALEIRSAPAYVLVSGHPPRLVSEGIAFEPQQVADEISGM